jgi:hypothetical protein
MPDLVCRKFLQEEDDDIFLQIAASDFYTTWDHLRSMAQLAVGFPRWKIVPLPFWCSTWAPWALIALEVSRDVSSINACDAIDLSVSIWIHGAGIYANQLGVYWWDPWHTIHSSTVRIRHGVCLDESHGTGLLQAIEMTARSGWSMLSIAAPRFKLI